MRFFSSEAKVNRAVGELCNALEFTHRMMKLSDEQGRLSPETKEQLQRMLRYVELAGLRRFEPELGSEFNPRYHREAPGTGQAATSNRIAHIVTGGYEWLGRVIVPAEVVRE